MKNGFSFLCYTIAWIIIGIVILSFISVSSRANILEETFEEQRIRLVLEKWNPIAIEYHEKDDLIVILHWRYNLTSKEIYEDIIVQLCQSHLQEVINLSKFRSIVISKTNKNLSELKGYFYTGGSEYCNKVIHGHKPFTYLSNHTNWELLKHTHPYEIEVKE